MVYIEDTNVKRRYKDSIVDRFILHFGSLDAGIDRGYNAKSLSHHHALMFLLTFLNIDEVKRMVTIIG